MTGGFEDSRTTAQAGSSATHPDLSAVVDGVQLALLGVDRLHRQLADELGINATGLNALGFLYTVDRLTPSQLAKHLDLGLAAITALTDHLDRHGYARREPHPKDRRSVHIALTPGGRHAAAWAHEQLTARVTEALASWTSDQIDVLATGMTIVGRHLLARHDA